MQGVDAGPGGSQLPKAVEMTYMVTLYNAAMRTVKIADLKAHLSAHLQRVRGGEEVLVCDRDKPVARIVPCDLRGSPERERQLVARGAIRPPLKKRSAAAWPKPPGNVSDEAMERVWREEREGR
jgi:prevent-host-death family protein